MPSSSYVYTVDMDWTTTTASNSTTYTIGDYNNYITSTAWIGYEPYRSADNYEDRWVPIPEEETEEQKQRRLATEAAVREIDRLHVEKQKQAEEKALQLLLDNLKENQIEIFKKTGCFVVMGQSGKKYKINKGRVRNVEELREDGTPERRMCFHPELQVPDYDTMLSQKLMLELNEHEARRIANFS